jgi:hypothetical protein
MNASSRDHSYDSHHGIEGHVDRATDIRRIDVGAAKIALQRSECVRLIADRDEVWRREIDDSDPPGSRCDPGEPKAGQGDNEHQHPNGEARTPSRASHAIAGRLDHGITPPPQQPDRRAGTLILPD